MILCSVCVKDQADTSMNRKQKFLTYPKPFSADKNAGSLQIGEEDTKGHLELVPG